LSADRIDSLQDGMLPARAMLEDSAALPHLETGRPGLGGALRVGAIPTILRISWLRVF